MVLVSTLKQGRVSDTSIFPFVHLCVESKPTRCSACCLLAFLLGLVLLLQVPGLSYIKMFPNPIPDVFVGQPLLVSGKYAGMWPEQVELVGTLPSGEREYIYT